MAREKERRVKSNREEIDFYPMNIIKDKKQVSVRIPKEVVNALDINPNKDIFVFTFDKKELVLVGSLEDAKLWWNEVKGKSQENE